MLLNNTQQLILYCIVFYLSIMMFQHWQFIIIIIILAIIYTKYIYEIIICFIIGYCRFYLTYITNNYFIGHIILLTDSIMVVSNYTNWIILKHYNVTNIYGKVKVYINLYSSSNYGNLIQIQYINQSCSIITHITKYIINILNKSKYFAEYMLFIFGLSVNMQIKSTFIYYNLYYFSRSNRQFMNLINLQTYIRKLLNLNMYINYYYDLTYLYIGVYIIINYYIWRIFGYNLALIYALTYNLFYIFKLSHTIKTCLSYIIVMLINPYYIFYTEFYFIFILSIAQNNLLTKLYFLPVISNIVLLPVQYIAYYIYCIKFIIIFGIILNLTLLINIADKLTSLFYFILNKIYIINIYVKIPLIIYILWHICSFYNILYDDITIYYILILTWGIYLII